MDYDYSQYFYYTQEELKLKLYEDLKELGYDPILTETYLYAEGTIPIALLAHLDTVFPEQARKNLTIFKVEGTSIISALEGLGADDRAGVQMIIKILRETDMRPHVMFTTDEETTLEGAWDLGVLGNPFNDLGYIIQLDRHGVDDCVFYDNQNEGFHKYVEKFGFKTAVGTYTDIDIICPYWGISGVNLSVGYKYEHTSHEILDIKAWTKTYKRVKKMLKKYNGEHWQYIGGLRYAWCYS